MMKLKNYSQLLNEELGDSNKYNYENIVKQGGYIPKGLETKINIYWFQWFFQDYNWTITGKTGVNYKDKDGKVKNFSGDWLDVPYPNAKTICIHSLTNMGEDLSDEQIRRVLGDTLIKSFGFNGIKRDDDGDAFCFVKNQRELTDQNYNWYELVQYMNDLLIEDGRHLDLGITGLECNGEEIQFHYST